MAEPTPDTVIARRAGPMTALVDDELVMLDPDRSAYFGLDRIGRRIWDLLEEPQSLGTLCATLGREFEVAPERCRADVVAFLETMREAELVELR